MHAEGKVYRVLDSTYWSVLERIARAGIDLQVVSPLPTVLAEYSRRSAGGAVDCGVWYRRSRCAVPGS